MKQWDGVYIKSEDKFGQITSINSEDGVDYAWVLRHNNESKKIITRFRLDELISIQQAVRVSASARPNAVQEWLRI